MYNPNYNGCKDIAIEEVFMSQYIYPADWNDCLAFARSKGYKYIDFNGNVYSTLDDNIDYRKCICERSDLLLEKEDVLIIRLIGERTIGSVMDFINANDLKCDIVTR